MANNIALEVRKISEGKRKEFRKKWEETINSEALKIYQLILKEIKEASHHGALSLQVNLKEYLNQYKNNGATEIGYKIVDIFENEDNGFQAYFSEGEIGDLHYYSISLTW